MLQTADFEITAHHKLTVLRETFHDYRDNDKLPELFGRTIRNDLPYSVHPHRDDQVLISQYRKVPAHAWI